MRVSLTVAIIGASIAATQAFAADADLLKQAQGLFSPIPANPPALKDNPATPAKVELGKALFFEPRMSKSHAISCASCHSPSTGGDDELETSIGHKWQIGGRNAPTVLNAVFNTAQFWDGRAKDLEAQAAGPIANPAEMATTHSHAIEMLKKISRLSAAVRGCVPWRSRSCHLGQCDQSHRCL